MRILHLCLANYYIDGYNYQENMLSRINQSDGHDVYILASTETFIDNVNLGYVNPMEYTSETGIPIKRLAYRKIFSRFISSKIRKYKGLSEELEKIKPDVIFMHDICFGSVGEIIKYKKEHPDVKLFADTHTAYYNSGQSWLSMNILHKIYYKHLIQKTVPFLERYYYIGDDERKFNIEVYKAPEYIMEYLPLGGVLPEREEYDRDRRQKREELNVSSDELLFVHTGKLHPSKKTDELLNAFYAVKDLPAKLIIIGSIPDEQEPLIGELIQRDSRVEYLGWKGSDEMMEYLCAADLYCQPGSVSSTLQNAICNYLPVLAYPYQTYLEMDCGNFIWVKEQEEIEEAFRGIKDERIRLEELKDKAVKCAEEFLDYRKLAQRYCGTEN